MPSTGISSNSTKKPNSVTPETTPVNVSPEQEAPETAGDFPFGLGRGAFTGVTLVRRHKQLVPGEDRPRRRAERKGQRPVHQQVGIAPDG